MKTVTIFGSSLPAQGEEEYEIAYRLGKYFGTAGLNVCSGGNLGIMDAVSRGCTEAGGMAIGITLSQFTVKPSQFLTTHLTTNSIFRRIQKLMDCGDAYVVLQGGTGTLLELASIWEYMNKGLMKKKPAAAYSALWAGVIPIVEEQVVREGRETELIKTFSDIELLSEYIINSLKK